MKVLWYCPKCSNEEIKDRLPNKEEQTWANIRDGFSTPIRHYKCKCGNVNAGAMHFGVIKERYTKDNVEYFKGVIEMYQ